MKITLALILILAAGVIAALVAGFILGRLSKSRKKPQNVAATAQKVTRLPADLEKRIQALIDDGHKIGALKEICDSMDIELEEAKTIIDTMQPSIPADKKTDKLGAVRFLIRNGQKDEALNLYRESSDMPLKEAEEVIAKLEKEFGSEPTERP